ncbi:hypothetical protein HLY00_463 [Mycolicibacterium hippocampi]|uniref:Uncharacterized protein n=1 Tax=Mycolicibacterium hippocampi TaxID=659824 RepID=A0A850PNW1_9MYCO|nr:hypothetical protein [Mycolicibacterium hippocampi]
MNPSDQLHDRGSHRRIARAIVSSRLRVRHAPSRYSRVVTFSATPVRLMRLSA